MYKMENLRVKKQQNPISIKGFRLEIAFNQDVKS